jgi:FkbM family methyltransferase
MNKENFDWGVMEGYDLKDLLIHELFEERIYNRHFEVKENDIIVDVGASVGPFIWTIMNNNPKHVYAFEPSVTEYPTLVKNTRGWPVTTINKAIWQGDGLTNQIDVYYCDGYVETMKFSTFRKLYAIDHINFLKTDCEGGEYEIFSDENIEFLKSSVDVIVGEWHLETPERKESFRKFRDVYLPRFKDVFVYSVDGADIKWDLYNEHFLQYYKQVIIHIDNRLDI